MHSSFIYYFFLAYLILFDTVVDTFTKNHVNGIAWWVCTLMLTDVFTCFTPILHSKLCCYLHKIHYYTQNQYSVKINYGIHECSQIEKTCLSSLANHKFCRVISMLWYIWACTWYGGLFYLIDKPQWQEFMVHNNLSQRVRLPCAINRIYSCC